MNEYGLDYKYFRFGRILEFCSIILRNKPMTKTKASDLEVELKPSKYSSDNRLIDLLANTI